MTPKMRGGTATDCRGVHSVARGRDTTVSKATIQLPQCWIRAPRRRRSVMRDQAHSKMVPSQGVREASVVRRAGPIAPPKMSTTMVVENEARAFATTSAIEKVEKQSRNVNMRIQFIQIGHGRFGVFKGDLDPWDARSWLVDVEETFELMKCPEDDKVLLAVFFLSGQAKYWWKSEKITLGENATSWSAFKAAFYGKYFSKTFQDNQRDEFLTIKQVGKSVQEYIANFYKLSYFFPEIVATERQKAQHFVRGLNHAIIGQMVSIALDSFQTVVDTALRVEATLIEISQEKQKEKAHSQFRHCRFHHQYGQSQSIKGGSQMMVESLGKKPKIMGIEFVGVGQLSQSMGSTAVVTKNCFKCGKLGHMARMCPLNEIQCYHCKQMGHYKKYCPQKGALLHYNNQQSCQLRLHQGRSSQYSHQLSKQKESQPYISALDREREAVSSSSNECVEVLPQLEDREQFLLLFACHNCKYQEVAEDSCVYKMEIKHSARGRSHSQQDAAADPTLPRTRNIKCSNCKHQEAVFFQAPAKGEEGMALFFICCNPSCGHRWRD